MNGTGGSRRWGEFSLIEKGSQSDVLDFGEFGGSVYSGWANESQYDGIGFATDLSERRMVHFLLLEMCLILANFEFPSFQMF